MSVFLTRTVARKSSVGGLYICARGLSILKFDETTLVFSVSYINLEGLGALFGGLSPPKSPLATVPTCFCMLVR